jgi:EmrB/QacA subfamily drug resistance transporter
MTDRRWPALALLAVTQFMLIADQTVVNIALPSMGADLDLQGVDLSWVVNAYVLTFGGLLLLAGRGSDVFGRRRMFVAGMLVFAGSSLAGGFAGSSGVLIAARAVQGVGAAVLASSGLAAMMATFPEGPDRNRALGIWAGAAGSGGAVGVLLGGLLTDGPGWPWVLWINVPVGIAGALLAPRLLAEAPRARDQRPDVAGAVSATAGVSLLVFAFTQAEHAGWTSAQTLVVLLVAVCLLAGFIAFERFAAQPLLPLRVFASRALSVANGAMVLFAASIYAVMFFLSLYLQQVLGYSPLEAGLAYVPLAMGVVFGPVGGRVLTAAGPRATMLGGLTLATAGVLWFSFISADGGFLVNVLGPSLLIASGGQFAVVGMTTFALAGVRDTDQGVASGLFNTSREVGGAFGVGLLAAVAASHTDAVEQASHTVALNDGYRLGMLGAAVMAALALLVATLLLPRATSTAAG